MKILLLGPEKDIILQEYVNCFNSTCIYVSIVTDNIKKNINKHVRSYYTPADTQINLGTDI